MNQPFLGEVFTRSRENRMTFRWLTRLALGLAIFTAMAVVAIPSLRYKAQGVLRGEPFYRGLPHQYWIDSLREGDAETRRTFFHRLHKNDAAVVPLLTKLLQEDAADLRRGAAEGLGRVGSAAAPAVRLLCGTALHDSDEQVRAEAKRALDQIGKAGLPEFMEALDDDQDAVRALAASRLGQLGTAAHPAVPRLLRLLQDQDRAVRQQAREALDRIGLDMEVAAPTLYQILEDETSDLRFWAAVTLVCLDASSADRAIPMLLQSFQAENPFRDRAIQALTNVGTPAVPALLRAAHDPDAHRRAGAVETLGGIHAPEVVPALFLALKDPEANVRQRATYALERSGRAIIPAEREALRDPEDLVRLTVLELLAKLGRTARSESGVVRVALKDPNGGVRKAAAAALEQVSPDEVPPLVAELAQLLRQGQAGPRIEAAKSLELFGARARPAIPALVTALEDKDPQVRAAAADALGEIGASAPESVTALSRGLKDQEILVRRSVVGALRKGVNFLKPGPQVRPVVTVLSEALKDPDPDVRRTAAEGFQEVVYQAFDRAALRLVIPALVEGLPDKEEKVRVQVEDALATALEKVTVDDQVLVPILIRALRQKTRIRSEAFEALVKILQGVTPADQSLIPDLLALLNEDTMSLEEQTQFLRALAKIGPGAKAAVPVLMELLRRHPVREIRPTPGSPESAKVIFRQTAIYVLGAIGPEAEPAVPLLIEVLKAEEPLRNAGASEKGSAPARSVPYGVRQTAAYALGRIGPAAKAAIPALTKASQDESKDLRAAASAALKQIEGKPGSGQTKPK
jgi:HEAT repeat protein